MRPDPYAILAEVERRWERGDSVADATTAIRRKFGVTLTAADIQPAFARMARDSRGKK